MHIAIFNWRDISHPKAGGAEIVTYEIARRWVAQGHQVTWFAAAYPNCLPRETRDGVEVVRRGKQYTVQWNAWQFYKEELQGQVDLILDQVNTIPFFTPLYAREPVIVWAHQLAREVWWYETGFPLNLIGYLTEPLYWQVYRRTPGITASESTQRDMHKLGIKNVERFTYGISAPPLAAPPADKTGPPLVLYVGRLVASKRVDHIVRAVAYARRTLPDLHLTIIGDGDPAYTQRLKTLVEKNTMQQHTIFTGRISETQKHDWMRKAHVLTLASVREGWGLVVVEANTQGTPTVVYDVPGLRDSVQQGQTGVICPQNTPEVLGGEIAKLLQDSHKLNTLAHNAWQYSQQFSWDRTAEEFMQGIQNLL